MLTKKILAEINDRPHKKRNLWPLVALGASVIFIAAYLLFSYTLALALLLAGAACVWLVYKRDRAGRTTSLVYALDAETGARLAAIQEACEALASSKRIRRVTEQRNRSLKPEAEPTSDGQRVEVGRLDTPGISTNVAIWGIDTGVLKVFFFPEAVLLYQGEQYRAISYESLKGSLSSTRFIEEEEVAEDAEVVGYSWRHTTGDGKPDRRYKPNPRLPLVLYGLLRLTGPSGLGISLQVSDRAAALRFAQAFGATEEHQRAREEPPREETSGSEEQQKAPLSAEPARNGAPYEALGVRVGAPLSEVTSAYRNLARIYHPDKVAKLGPEVREFADNKMKEINAAYAELRRSTKQHPSVFEGSPPNGKEGEKRA
jgi:hypothetical protein